MPSAVAIHEAGHAVACLALGGWVELVTIEPTANAAGMTTTWMPNRRAQAVVTAAGPVAEAVIAEENRWWRFASRGDIDNLRKYAHETGAGNDDDAIAVFIHAAGRRAIALLGERKIWQKVEALATWLDCDRTLRFRPP